MSEPKLQTLSREELYEKVWSSSGVKLSEELGVSDVAIAKRCQKLNVPRPPRGYWAKVEAGQQPKRPPLPPSAESKFIQEAQKPIGKSLVLPADSEALHPLAAEFLKAIKEGKLSYDKKRVNLRESALPEAEISKEIAPRAAQAFHAVLQVVEARGIHFRKCQSRYGGGHFRKGNDRLYFKLEEELVAKPHADVRRSRTYGYREEPTVLSGRLSISLDETSYSSSKAKRWVESEKISLEVVVAEAAKFVCDFYVEAQKRRETEKIEQEKRRAEEEIRWKKHQEEQAVRAQEKEREEHAKSLREVADHRIEDLAKAAEWWHFHESAVAFIAECERRWRNAKGGELSSEQCDWLAWANETAKNASPFESGYPDPSRDGKFDPTSVPFGGPYPEARHFPKPPSMPEIPAPVVVQQGYGAPSHQPPPQRFPFWLMHRRR